MLIDVLANDFDANANANGDALMLDVVDNPQHGTIEKQDGKVFYKPDYITPVKTFSITACTMALDIMVRV